MSILETVTSLADVSELKDNQIIGDIELRQSKVVFNGKGNILIAPPSSVESTGVILENSTISFNQSNSVTFLDSSKDKYFINLSLFNNCFCYIGENNYFNGILTMQCSEHSNIIIGDSCMFSSGIWIRTSDVHLIYDVETHQRVNYSKSVFIGDHVWIGQDAKLWKGTKIGSGSILGADSFTTGKTIPSNTAWGGNPAKQIRDGVFFVRAISVHAFTVVETKASREYPYDEGVFKFDENETIDFTDFERAITTYTQAEERAVFLHEFSKSKWKNRFYINEAP